MIRLCAARRDCWMTPSGFRLILPRFGGPLPRLRLENLANSGLDSTSPQPSGPWGEQIKVMVNEFGPALKEMGLVK